MTAALWLFYKIYDSCNSWSSEPKSTNFVGLFPSQGWRWKGNTINRAVNFGCLWFYKHPPFTKVKPGRAGLVLGWVTAWEYPVSRAPFYLRSPPKIEVVYQHSVSANNIHLLHSNSPRVQVSTSQRSVGQMCDSTSHVGIQHDWKFQLESATSTQHWVRMVGIRSTPMWAGLVAITTWDNRVAH